MRLQPRSLPLLCQVLALAVTACVPIDGPPPLQPEAFRFDGRLYHLAELSGMVVPFDALSPIGQAEPLDGTKALADPTVYAAEGVDPAAAAFAAVDAGGGASLLDLFVSGFGPQGEPLYPDGICQYVPLGEMPSGLSVSCSPPFIVEVLGRRYVDSYAIFEIGPAELSVLGGFDVVEGGRPPELGATANRITGVPPDTAVALTLGGRVLVYVREGLFEEQVKVLGEDGPLLPPALCDRLADGSNAAPWCG